MFGFNPVPKPKHQRGKKTAKQRGEISDRVRAAAKERAGGRCEACGWYEGSYDPSGRKWGLQCAHLIRRWDVDGETTETEVAMLCGPSVNSGTCHHLADYTAAGKEWGFRYRDYLLGNLAIKPKLI